MANTDIQITSKHRVTRIELPNSNVSGGIGGTLKLEGFKNLRILKDENSNAIADIEGWPSSYTFGDDLWWLNTFRFTGSTDGQGNATVLGNAKLGAVTNDGNKYIANWPPYIIDFTIHSNDSKITGEMDQTFPNGFRYLTIIGNNNEITGNFPNSLPSSFDTVQIRGNKLNFSGNNFLPATINYGMYNFIVTNESNNQLSSHESALPNNLDGSIKLRRFNVMNCKLKGALPTQNQGAASQNDERITPSMQDFKIGGKANNGQYHSGLNNNQKFPNFKHCRSLNKLNIINLKAGANGPKITSCTTTVFENCRFFTNATLKLDYNAFTANTVNQILKAVDNADTVTVSTGRTLSLKGNYPPFGMTATKTKAEIEAGETTGNDALDSLILKNWNVLYNTSGQNANFNWPT